ncbi:U6 snRNA-associated Sm-like protein LSm2 [Talaromyces islandicus]|uniref:U6 snRNA-associated Sm-like protein LSm2 n=1 Tax=Talaromyces islandicus TaxID=28573 RepID=A0A0U1LI79_TALIS|nr:U6 snRNA-associated Sm-like protein LSm2 [Talaromyces islandicus]
MLFFSFFKTLTNHVVTVELKNDIRIRGTLKSVDQYLNIKLDDVDVLDLDKYPHLSSVKNMFIRGSVVRYVVLPQAEVDRGLLEDATRRGGFPIRRSYANSLNCFRFDDVPVKISNSKNSDLSICMEMLTFILLQRLRTKLAKLDECVR